MNLLQYHSIPNSRLKSNDKGKTVGFPLANRKNIKLAEKFIP